MATLHSIARVLREQAADMRNHQRLIINPFMRAETPLSRQRAVVMFEAAAELLDMHEEEAIYLTSPDVPGLRGLVNVAIEMAGFPSSVLEPDPALRDWTKVADDEYRERESDG